MKNMIFRFLGCFYILLPSGTLIAVIWYAMNKSPWHTMDTFGLLISTLGCIVGIILFTPIGIMMLRNH